MGRHALVTPSAVYTAWMLIVEAGGAVVGVESGRKRKKLDAMTLEEKAPYVMGASDPDEYGDVKILVEEAKARGGMVMVVGAFEVAVGSPIPGVVIVEAIPANPWCQTEGIREK